MHDGDEQLIAVGFVRQSDEHRQGNNHSAEEQESQIRAAAKHFGCRDVKIFKDFASAFHIPMASRDGINDMMNFVLGRTDVWGVFFYDLSRGSRQGGSDMYHDVAKVLWSHQPDLRFVSAIDYAEVDFNDPITQIKFALHRYESEEKRKRTIDRQSKTVDQHRRPGSVVPFGFQQDEGILVPNDKAPVVYFIFYLAYWGYSDESIAQVLNDCKIPPPGKSDKSKPRLKDEWVDSTIHDMLHNEAYIGNLVWGKRHFLGNKFVKDAGQVRLFERVFAPIIPMYMWQAVSELRRIKSNSPKYTNTENILLGMLYCKDCGFGLKPKNNTPSSSVKKYVYYRCQQCGYSVRASTINEQFIQRLTLELRRPLSERRRQADKAVRTLIQIIERSIEQLREDVETFKYEMVRNRVNGLTEEDYNRGLTILQGRMRQKELDLEYAKTVQEELTNYEMISPIENYMQLLSPTELRALCVHSNVRVEIDGRTKSRLSIEMQLTPFI